MMTRCRHAVKDERSINILTHTSEIFLPSNRFNISSDLDTSTSQLSETEASGSERQDHRCLLSKDPLSCLSARPLWEQNWMFPYTSAELSGPTEPQRLKTHLCLWTLDRLISSSAESFQTNFWRGIRNSTDGMKCERSESIKSSSRHTHTLTHKRQTVCTMTHSQKSWRLLKITCYKSVLRSDAAEAFLVRTVQSDVL